MLSKVSLYPIYNAIKRQFNLYTCLSLVILTLLVYWPVLQAQFLMQWDDQWVVMNYYTENGFTPDNLWNVLTEFYQGQYSPINELFYITLYALFGYNPFFFHLACLLVHTANGLLVFTFIKRLLIQTKSFNVNAATRIAFITALLMAVHPFLVEAVAWVSASKVLLYVMFYLGALLMYLRYCETHRVKYFLFTLLLFIISFGAKEQAVVMAFCLLLLDYVLKRDMLNYRVWLEKLPFVILALFFGFVTMLSQSAAGNGILAEEQTYPLYQRIVFACYSLSEYLIKCLVPVKLSYIYPFPNQVGEALSLRFWVYPVVAVFLTISLWNLWKQRWVFFGIAFFIIHLAVALHIIPLSRFAIVADRYVYLASVGIFFIMAFYLNKAFEQKTIVWKIGILTYLSYVITIGSYAYTRIKVWHDVASLKKELREQVKQRKDYQSLSRKLDYYK